jgi:hypothetical protein
MTEILLKVALNTISSNPKIPLERPPVLKDHPVLNGHISLVISIVTIGRVARIVE